ncbi:uncharacterized protein LOC126906701 [Daktulosphaira vitifoliae]|uniref:uncharacterized protein LOC126906701 n=1 Tax=Daktulosphaira vitifoliae TaxID=58002 RepID=UPI0021A98375|nr:uncharacterized protein LOC126906701 [Daktulosphaira vitifoliae]
MLLHTAVKLELISDYEKQIFISRGIRGGMTNSILKYAQANNLKTPNYDAEKPKSEIIYLDVNNLYGWSMSQNLPYAGFRWIDEDHETVLKRVREMDEDSDIGLALEVTVTYPEGKHDMHNEMPFLPENRIPPNSKAKKLLSTLETKEHYVVHYLNLQQAMENGLKVEKVHKVLEFKQSRWLSKYIKLNTEMRQAATNDFEKDFFKLMNNSVFGKCMERVEFRKKMELVCDPKRAAKLIKKHTFNHCVTYKENLSIFVLDNKIIHFTKPVYAGFCILDISKTLVYDFHYNYMKKHFKDRIMLMYGDTDSLVYYVLTENFYAEIKEHPELMERFDTSSLPKDHFCYSAARKKVPGLWSDECGGKAILEFVSLRTKAYGFDVEGTEKIKAKGIRRPTVKYHLTVEDFKHCLFADDEGDIGIIEAKEAAVLCGAEVNKNIHERADNPSLPIIKYHTYTPYRENVSIRSYKHDVYTIKSMKMTLNRLDDKRVILPNRINTSAHGHYRLRKPAADEEAPEK